ncbi:MAG: insulinase family protein [Calditrichia bacterium]
MELDPQVKHGQLSNGLTYYIRENRKPEKRAELHLVVNAGSILESDAQVGLAHFVEHMAFNGTRKYKKQELLDLLESFGMRLGPDLNAYTSFDETVYMIQIPTDSLELLRTGLDVLHEWSKNLAFEPEEIDKERGVIIEEWRLGRGADARMRDKELPVILHNSRYAERLPIGKVENLERFPHSVLKDFYYDWYRPDLMAIVAVGDFEAEQIESWIKEIFQDLESPANAPKRENFPVPDHEETLFSIVTDPEASYEYLSLLFKRPSEPEKNTADFRRHLLQSLFTQMMNQRLQELTRQANPPFIFGSVNAGSFVRTKDVTVLSAMVKDGEYLLALKTILTEIERARKFGFTPGELERQKQEMLRYYEQKFKERTKTESRLFAKAYVRNYLSGDPAIGIEKEYELIKSMLPGIRVEEVISEIPDLLPKKNLVVSIRGPEDRKDKIPTPAELTRVIDQVAKADIVPYQDKTLDEPLLPQKLQPGKILEEESDPKTGITRLKLSNNVTVFFKPTLFKNDQILMSAISPGGSSLAADSVYYDALFSASFVSQSGLGKFGPIELENKLAGKIVRVTPRLGSLYEGFRGSAAPQDLETLFQMVYLYFTNPRMDTAVVKSNLLRMADFIAKKSRSPEAVFDDSLRVTITDHHPRKKPLTREALSTIKSEEALAFYKDRFKDASDFTFFFVGNFDADSLKEFCQKYLANLPAIRRVETWKDEGVHFPARPLQKIIRRGLEQKSYVHIEYAGDFEWNIRNRIHIQALADVLQLKLREALREDAGGTYSVSASANLKHYPGGTYRLTIDFGCSPNRVEELTKIVYQQIDSLKTAPLKELYIEKYKEKARRSFEKNLKKNKYWLANLQEAFWHQEPFETIMEGPLPYLDEITPDQIHKLAKLYLRPEREIKLVLLPEN